MEDGCPAADSALERRTGKLQGRPGEAKVQERTTSATLFEKTNPIGWQSPAVPSPFGYAESLP